MSTSATLIFRGRLGSDPQLRTTQTGEPVANFNLAIDQGYGERKSTVWVRVVVWGKQAEACQRYLSKGDLVCVHAERFQVAVPPAAWSSSSPSAERLPTPAQRRICPSSPHDILPYHRTARASVSFLCCSRSRFAERLGTCVGDFHGCSVCLCAAWARLAARPVVALRRPTPPDSVISHVRQGASYVAMVPGSLSGGVAS